MAEKNKSIDQKVSDIFKDLDKTSGKDWGERKKMIDNYLDKTKNYGNLFNNYAIDVFFGTTGKGAYQSAIASIAKKRDDDKLNESEINALLEEYADAALTRLLPDFAARKADWKKALQSAKKDDKDRLAKEIRNAKEQLLSHYLKDEEGKPVQFFGVSNDLINKTKSEVVNILYRLAKEHVDDNYRYLSRLPADKLIKHPDDHLKMNKAAYDAAKAAGWKVPDRIKAYNINQSYNLYATLRTGGDVTSHGLEKEKEKKK